MALVDEIRASAQEMLDRGFAILAVQPHKKDPWAKYSPHAVVSSTRKPEIALKPWDDGTEANYGVGCGPSNLTVLDVDSGLKSLDEWKAWKEKLKLPDTLTVLSGRDGEFVGVHMYYSGAVPTCGYNIDGVVGELRGIGAYVVGPGSVHPSGKKYEIINKTDVVPLPEGLLQIAKDKQKGLIDFKPEGDNLIPAGNRWHHLQSKAGSLKNLGLGEDAIYFALKDFCSRWCEDGDNYPDERIKGIAQWAGGDKCDIDMEALGLVTVGTPDPEGDSSIPELPLDAVEGDYVGDLATALTTETFIPPAFARGSLKVIVGTLIDGLIGFPGEPTLHTRHWNTLVSSRPEAGKSVIWERIMTATLLKQYMIKQSVVFPSAGFFSSGEHAIRVLSENDGKKHLAYFDEMKELFDKGGNTGSTLFSKIMSLYEQKQAAVGSVGSGKAECNDMSLSMTGGFTREGFDRSVAGKGAGGNGFLSRMVTEYSNGINYVGDWGALDPTKVNTAVSGITSSVDWLTDKVVTLKEQNGKKPAAEQIPANMVTFVPEEDPDALTARQAFQKWLAEEKTRIENKYPGSSLASRLEAHFKRDILVRVICTPEKRITKAIVTRSIVWAKHQLMLREVLWPVDSGGAVEKFEKRIMHAIDKWGPLTKSGVQKFSNASNGEGGYDAWNRAWTNLIRAEKIDQTKVKSDRGKEKWGFVDNIWDKGKHKWVVR